MLKVKVEGYAEAKRILDELPNTMQKSMLLAALRTSARPMLQTAKNRVPVRSGRLRKQLRIVRFKDRTAPKSEVDIAVKPVFEHKKEGCGKSVLRQIHPRRNCRSPHTPQEREASAGLH